MAAPLREALRRLVDEFVDGVLAAIRASSLEEILAETGAPRRGPGRPRKAALPGAPEHVDARARAPGGRADGRRLARRSAGALDEVVDRIVGLLEHHARGLRAEEIRAELGLSPKELPRPIAKGLSAKRIRKTGQKRATVYFASGGGASRH